MNRKTMLLLLSAAMLAAPLGATTLDAIIDGAKELSPSFRNTEISYKNSLINVQRLETKADEPVLTVTGSRASGLGQAVTTYTPSETGAVLYVDDDKITATPSISLVLPNDGKTTLTGSLGVTRLFDGSTTSLSGAVGVNHTVDFVNYKSNADDLSYTQAKYSTELTYRRATLSFEKTVINTVSSLLSTEKSLNASRRNVEKQRTSLENMKALGTYSEDSPIYTRSLNSLITLENSLEASEQSFQDALRNYETLSGLKWDYLDELPEPELELVTYENGNTSVLLTSISAESAMDTYLRTLAAYNPNKIDFGGNAAAGTDFDGKSTYNLSANGTYVSEKLSGGLTASVSYNDQNSMFVPETTVYSLSGSARYAEDNWNIQVAPTLTVTHTSSDTTYKPTVTVSGKWTNATQSYDAKDLDLQRLMNSAQSAQNDYINVMSSYTQEGQNYAVRIMSWNYRKAQAQANRDYLQMVLDNQKTMYELGLATKTSVEDAEFDLAQTEYDWKILMLEGLSLQRDLQIYAL